ncbi:MAG TPA: thiamine pyrophosphate-binding protein [Gammaproteobacteria bacterium]|nr:thiamine pyrophosphate-binding protein [Gammaproteobacteria bacterium]
MRSLFKKFFDHEISRRDFGTKLLALGFSQIAVNSFLGAAAEAREPLPEMGVKMSGTGADILAATLRAAGVDYIFGTSATGMSPFFDALTVNNDMQFISSIAESQATSMAHGYELVTGKTAVLFIPGVAIPSAMNNLYNAWKDRSSIAVLSDGSSSNFAGRNGFQQMDDWLDPMTQFTKWQWQVNNERQISEMLRRTLKLAETPPGGPVYLRFPGFLLSKPNIRQTIYPQSRFKIPMELYPKPELIEATARALLEAKKPLLCVGHEVTRARANKDVLELAELLGIRMAQGYSVFGDIPFRHPLFAGFYGLGIPRGLANTDVFLNLGAPMPDPTIFTAPVPSKAKVIHARIEYDEIANTYPTDIAIAAGMKETVTAIIDSVRALATEDQIKTLREERLQESIEINAKHEARKQQQAKATWNSSPISWERASFEMEKYLDPYAIIVSELDTRKPFEWMNLGPDAKWLIGGTTGFALGWGIGASLGVKIGEPNRQVVCLVGDGAMLFGQIEALWTAARYDIPVTVIVFNNLSYDGERNRIYRGSPLAAKKETRGLWRDISCFLGNPEVDFVGLADSFEIQGKRANNPEEFVECLLEAAKVTADGRPFLIDLRVMQLDTSGKPTEQTWYPDISIAAKRMKKI